MRCHGKRVSNQMRRGTLPIHWFCPVGDDRRSGAPAWKSGIEPVARKYCIVLASNRREVAHCRE